LTRGIEQVAEVEFGTVRAETAAAAAVKGELPEVVTRYGGWSDRQILICGRPAMVTETRAALIAKGAPAERIQHDPLPG
jgi:NAD(P)H-flavin reductase